MQPRLRPFGSRQERTETIGLNMPCSPRHSSGVPYVPGQMVAVGRLNLYHACEFV